MRLALEQAGFAPTFERVDIEPALHAALVRGGFDAVIYDPATPGLSRATVAACIDKLRPGLPFVQLRDLTELAHQIAAVLEARRN